MKGVRKYTKTNCRSHITKLSIPRILSMPSRIASSGLSALGPQPEPRQLSEDSKLDCFLAMHNIEQCVIRAKKHKGPNFNGQLCMFSRFRKER